jgi:hypothetical protein
LAAADGDNAMTRDITGADSEHLLDEGWSTPLEAGVRGTIRGFIEALLEEELETALGRARYARLKTAAGERAAARRQGSAMRSLRPAPCPRRATATGGASAR